MKNLLHIILVCQILHKVDCAQHNDLHYKYGSEPTLTIKSHLESVRAADGKEGWIEHFDGYSSAGSRTDESEGGGSLLKKSQVKDVYDNAQGERSQINLLIKPVETTIVVADFGDIFTNFQVNLTSQYLFIYNYTEKENQTTAVRIRVSCTNVDEEFPVMFVARQQQGILSWKVPLEIGDGFSFWSVSRTLCPINKVHKKEKYEDQLIYLTVSTMAHLDRNFSLTAQLLDDFELRHESPKTFSVSASRPKYFLYTFPAGVDSVRVKVTSPSGTCMTVSVQTVRCPVFDLDTNVDYEGKHQTMTTQAGMFLQRKDYPMTNSFYVVFITKPSNEVCEGYVPLAPLVPPGESTEVNKEVTVEVKDTIDAMQFAKAVGSTLVFFFGFYIIAAVIGCFFAGCGLRKDIGDLTESERASRQLLFDHISSNPTERNSLIEGDNFINRQRGDTGGGYGAIPDRELGATSDLPPPQGPDVDENEIDFLPDADSEKEVFRTKTALFVSDLSRKKRTKLAKLYKLYHWNLLTIAIFYGLPVAQLVLTYQKVLQQTGNQDLCYYNFACSHPDPLGSYLSSFNNVFSNIGYVLLGLLFIVIVHYRARNNKQIVETYGKMEDKLGIPQHFGLFYAMGIGLVMEGVMSGCYHICPNYSNFQFDTSFMYIIACLCMLKIYQSRHPDINARAHMAYFIMAVVIFLAVVGVVYGNAALWIVYACVHILLTMFLTAQIYYMGRWKIDRYIFKRLFHTFVSDCRRISRPVYPDRFVMLLIGNFVNWAFALYGAIARPSDFATYLLAVFIGNLLLYCLFYIIMKLLSKESLNWLVIAFILISMVTWTFSLFFFFQHLTSWQKTPAESRAGNKECILMEFYDAHDVWHFLSAISLFFSFMTLLILDDDLSLKRRDQIPVF